MHKKTHQTAMAGEFKPFCQKGKVQINDLINGITMGAGYQVDHHLGL